MLRKTMKPQPGLKSVWVGPDGHAMRFSDITDAVRRTTNAISGSPITPSILRRAIITETVVLKMRYENLVRNIAFTDM
jgi:hypothetical protein